MRILVTGANRGIGAALAVLAAEQGHTVIRAQRTGGDIACDLTILEAIPAAFAGLTGPVDVLVNNAGVIGPDRQDPLDTDFDGFLHTLTVNTLAPLAVAQALLPRLRESGQGRVLTVSSQMSWMGYRKSDHIAYRASKAAVNKVMQGLATAVEPDGIAVALVDPGWVRTDMGGAAAEEDPHEVGKGILALAERLTLADTGRFFRFSGEERAF